MSRYKSIRNPELTEAEKQQILSRLIELKSYLNGCSARLEIGSEDYDLLQRLGREIMSAGETIAKSEYWGKTSHSIGR